MKKLIVGVVAVGAVIALRPVLKRRMVQTMREHCKQMAVHCKEMMGAQPGDRGETTGQDAMHQKMREHCGPLAAEHEDQHKTVARA
jgi:hypothetical protein